MSTSDREGDGAQPDPVTWTMNDRFHANLQGWNVWHWHSMMPPYDVKSAIGTEPRVPSADERTAAFVIQRAQEGDRLCQKAVTYVMAKRLAR